MTRNFLARWFALVLLALLCGCAAAPHVATEGRQRSDMLLQSQLQAARQASSQGGPPRVIFAGFALNSLSKAFHSDVLLAEKAARVADPHAIILRLGNPALGDPSDWPLATRENVAVVLREVGSIARPQDKVLILFTSHGSRNALHINASKTEIGVITPADLQEWLGALRDKPTLLVISACFSGSFLEPLRSPTRIILTASSRDRSSFGCQFNSRNTFFVEELWGHQALGNLSTAELMAR
ncbi:MAG: C13 family peptidase, partial [Ramlibacter sp.]